MYLSKMLCRPSILLLKILKVVPSEIGGILWARGLRTSTLAFFDSSGSSKGNHSNDRNVFTEPWRDKDDVFGSYGKLSSNFMADDPEDASLMNSLKEAKTTKEYIEEVKSLLACHKHNEAMELFMKEAIGKHKIRPPPIFYNLLISSCARHDDLKRAYKLFVNAGKRKLLNGGIYTSILNTCANSSNSNLALEIANKVWDRMDSDPNYTANVKNYNALSKAFAKHGDLKSCLRVTDKVLEERKKVAADVFNSLLQACVTDKISGFRHALLIWHKMLGRKVTPDIITYHLMLRVTRECSVGDPLLFHEMIRTILIEQADRKMKLKFQLSQPASDTERIASKESANEHVGNIMEITQIGNRVHDQHDDEESPQEKHQELIHNTFKVNAQNRDDKREPHSYEEGTREGMESDLPDNEECTGPKNAENINFHLEVGYLINNKRLPNLLTVKPLRGDVEGFNDVVGPVQRVMLLGGITGVLKSMKEFKVPPCAKTFSYLLALVPHTVEAEEQMLSLARSENVKLDTIFLNELIKKRTNRGDLKAAKDCLLYFQKERLQPDLVTYGSLATCCETRKEGVDLINSVRAAGIRVNDYILNTLLRKAIDREDIEYILLVLKTAREEEVEQSLKLINNVRGFIRNLMERKLGVASDYQNDKVVNSKFF